MAQTERYTLDAIDFGIGGSTEPVRFYLRNQAGEVFDATGYTVYLAISKINNTTAIPEVSKTLTLLVDDDGKYSIAEYVPLVADTINLEGKYEYQLTIKDSEVNDSQKGAIYIYKNVNKSVIS